MPDKEFHQTGCPHSFQFLNIPKLNWSPKVQRLFADLITWRGQYGLKTQLITRERSPDPERIILTPNGVLQVCVILSPPIPLERPDRILTMRDETHTRACNNRPELIEDIARSLLNYERGCIEMMQVFNTIKQDATIGLRSLDTALKLLNALRTKKLMPKQNKRLPNSTTLTEAFEDLRTAVQAIPDDVHERMKRINLIDLITTDFLVVTLNKDILDALHRQIKIQKGEARNIAAAILIHFGIVDSKSISRTADSLRHLTESVQGRFFLP